jgi:hypothetical protein
MDAQAEMEPLAELITLNHSGGYGALIQASQATPIVKDGLFLHANAHYLIKEPPQAWPLAHQVINIEPRHSAALTPLACIANRRGQPTIARRFLEALELINPIASLLNQSNYVYESAELFNNFI